MGLRFSQTLTATSFPSHLLVHHFRTKGFIVRLMLSFFLWYPAEYFLLSKTLVLRLESPSIISFSIYKYEEDLMDSPKNREHRAPTLHLWSTMTFLVLEIYCILSRFWSKETTRVSNQPWLLPR